MNKRKRGLSHEGLAGEPPLQRQKRCFQLLVQVDGTTTQKRKLHTLNFQQTRWSRLRIFDVLIKVERLTKIAAVFLVARDAQGVLPCEASLTDLGLRPGDTIRIEPKNTRWKEQTQGYARFLEAALKQRLDPQEVAALKANLQTMVYAELNIGKLICKSIAPPLERNFKTHVAAQALTRMLLEETNEKGNMIDPDQRDALLYADNSALWTTLIQFDSNFRNKWINEHLPKRVEDMKREIRVRRHDIVNSTYRAMMTVHKVPPGEMMWQAGHAGGPCLAGGIQAYYAGEDGQGPGVTTEFLAHVVPELLKPGWGYFKACSESPHLFYPNHEKCINNGRGKNGLGFRMAGRLMALALLHRVHLPVSLAPHVWYYLTVSEAQAEKFIGPYNDYSEQRDDFGRLQLDWPDLIAVASDDKRRNRQLDYLEAVMPDKRRSYRKMEGMDDATLRSLDMRFTAVQAGRAKKITEADVDKMGVIQLCKHLRKRGLPCTGLEPELRPRLKSALQDGTVALLLSDGKQVIVTKANLHVYILRKCMWDLYRIAGPQLAAIRRGFRDVFQADTDYPLRLKGIAGESVGHPNALLTGHHLCEYSLGAEDISVREWKANTQYKGWNTPYPPGCPTINNFWMWLEGLNKVNRMKVFTFCTSLTRLPPNGFRGLSQNFTIVRAAPEMLPSAHTCFYELVLPDVEAYHLVASKCSYMLIDHKFDFA